MMLPADLRHRIQLVSAQDRVPGRCWVWDRPTRKGYGHVSRRRYSSCLAHRAAYELLVGPIPAGLQIDHLCRVRACINPRHLEPVTNLENSLRSDRATRSHCIRGHALVGANLIVKKPGSRGRRRCRICYYAAIRRCDERRRAREGSAS